MKKSKQQAVSSDLKVKREGQISRLYPYVSLTGALILSSYLAWVSYSSSGVSACSEGGSCGVVLASKWSKVFGLPIALVGSVSYAFVLWHVKRVRQREQDLRTMFVLILMWLIPFAAFWFFYVQAVLLKAFCPFCCLTHILATSSIVVLWIQRSRRKEKLSNTTSFKFTPLTPFVAAALFIVLVVVQRFDEEPEGIEITEVSKTLIQETSEAKSNQGPRLLSLHDGGFEFDLKDTPLAGEPSAEHAMVVISDYSCGHCRKLMGALKPVQEAYGDNRLAVVHLPGFKNQKSLELAKIILPLWKGRPKLYKALNEELYFGKLPATKEKVLEKIYQQMGGEGPYLAAIAPHQQWTQDLIQRSSRLFHENAKITGRKVIPQLMVGDEVVVGFSSAPERYYQLVSKHFELPNLFNQEDLFAQNKESNSEDSKKTLTNITPTPRLISLPKQVLQLDANAFPLKGSPTAKHLAVLFYDYSCPYCVLLHKRLARVLGQYNKNELGLVLLPGIRGSTSEQVHRLMLAVWHESPELYHQLNEQLFSEKLKLNSREIEKKIAEVLGEERSSQLKSKYADAVEQQISLSKKIYANNRGQGKQGFPQLLVGDEISAGAYPKDAYYFSLFERVFDLSNPSSRLVQKSSSHLGEKGVLVQSEVRASQKIKNQTQRLSSESGNKQGVLIAQSRNGSELTFFDSKHLIDAKEMPIWGSPNAERIVTILVDFQSKPSLEALSSLLEKQASSSSNEFAVILLPAMPSGEAQKIHREMLFVLKSDKEKYTKLVSDIMMSKKVLTYDEIQKEISLLKDDSGSVDRTAHAAWIQDLLIVTHRIFLKTRRDTQFRSLPLIFDGEHVYSHSLPESMKLSFLKAGQS